MKRFSDQTQALASADVAIAIGSGSECQGSTDFCAQLTSYLFPGDVALSSASFILVSSDLSSILTLVDLSRTVFRRVKFNFVSTYIFVILKRNSPSPRQLWACLYNMAALPIAAGVIYPAGHARLDPVWGSLAMALS